MPGLDRYDPAQLDEDDYDEMEIGDRRAAEEAMRKRDREQGILRRDDQELFYEKEDDDQVSFNVILIDKNLNKFAFKGTSTKKEDG